MAHNVCGSNFRNPDVNPCIKESNLVKDCLDLNLYVHTKCIEYFDNYKECKKFWGAISKDRVRAGISPRLPNMEEREKILKLKKKGIHSISVNE